MLLSLIKLEITRVINSIVHHDSSVTQKPYRMHNELTSAWRELHDVCGCWVRYVPTAMGKEQRSYRPHRPSTCHFAQDSGNGSDINSVAVSRQVKSPLRGSLNRITLKQNLSSSEL